MRRYGLIDMNVLVYARGKPHPLREPSLRLLGAASKGGVKARTIGVEIFERHAALESANALIAAAALSHGTDALVTADKSFTAVPGLLVVDPRSPYLDTLLCR